MTQQTTRLDDASPVAARTSARRVADPHVGGHPAVLHGLQSLQRAVGNQGVSRLVTLQRFRSVDHSAVTTTVDASLSRPFMGQTDRLQIGARASGKPGLGMSVPTEQSVSPALHVADDNTLAINAASDEPKDFFASPAVIRSANSELAAVNSPIELLSVGNTVRVPAAGTAPETVLSMVRPAARDKPPPGVDEFAELGVDICRDMAKAVLAGAITHAVIGVGAERHRTPIGQIGGTEVGGALKLAEGLGSGDVSLDDATARLASGESPAAGKSYGEALKAGDVTGRSATLGVNERAKARVGEAYVTQSVPASDAEGGTKQEHSARGLAPFGREFVWGYHFGSVVAASSDARDQVLLENYARVSDLKEGQARLLEQLKTTYATELRGITLAGTPADQIGAALIAAGDMEPSARQAYSTMYREEVGSLARLWYFRMVGEAAGQSFHAQMAGSGYFVNPLTMAVAHQQLTPSRVRFGVGAATLGDDFTRRQCASIGRAAMADLHSDALPGRILLTGYRSQTWSPVQAYSTAGIGRLRAEAVAVALRAQGVPDDRIVTADGGGTKKFGEVNDVVDVTLTG